MFGFKSKVTIDEFVTDKLKQLFAEAWIARMQWIKRLCDDVGMNKIDDNSFLLIMNAIYMQLFGVCLLNAYNIEYSIAFHTSLTSLSGDYSEDFNAIFKKYNSAYGADTNDGLAGMLHCFNNSSSLHFSNVTFKLLYEYFILETRVMLDEIKKKIIVN